MMHRFFVPVAILSLAACGSSPGPDKNVVPLSASGFAQAGQTLDGPIDLTLRNTVRFVEDGSGARAFERQTVRVAAGPGVGEFTVVVDGQSYILTITDPSGTRADLGDLENPASDFVQLSLNDLFDGVVAPASLFVRVDGKFNSGDIVLGLDTDPATVAARQDNAQFIGEVYLTLLDSRGSGFGFSDNLSLDVDFDTKQISGSALVENRDSQEADFDIAPIALVFNSGSISENGFSGALSLSQNGEDVSSGDAAYEGRFFGAEAESVGGQVFGEVALIGTAGTTLFEGAFVGDE